MLDEEFKKATRPNSARFGKESGRSLHQEASSRLARYEDDDFKTASTQTPIDLQFESRAIGPEK
jgi:hypothetical protein